MLVNPALSRRGADSLPILLTGARVLDANGAGWIEGMDVQIAGGRISRIAPRGAHEAPEDSQTIGLDGHHLIPGLIDLHTHLLLRPYTEASWDDQVLREPLELRTIRAVAAARATLAAGFTTIRDLGTEGAGYADVALRDAVALGIVEGPRVIATTRAIVATGCYGPYGFDPRWDVPKGAQVADGADGVRRAVREQAGAGADWIKVYADGRRRRGGPSLPSFSLPELEALVDEARSAGLPVAAHAATDEGIRRAVLAGASTIEHGFEASEGTLDLMRERGVVLCPTLAAREAFAMAGAARGERPFIPGGFMRALVAGVAIACGSDAGVFAHGENVREIELMVECGMSPAAALRAATSLAAAVLGLANEVGAIVEGAVADLVAVQGNPLVDPGSLRAPSLVLRSGRAVHDALSTPLPARA